MLRILTFFLFSFLFSDSIFSQEVNAIYDIQPNSAVNEYTIKTKITGLIGADIARIKYLINNEHTYKPSPNNQLFSDRNENYIKFYVMAIPSSGIINVEFGINLGGSGDYSFPVELQYSRNEEKKVLNLPGISIKGIGILATVETPKPTPPIVKEELIVEAPKPTPPTIKEEIVVEVVSPTPPVVKEEPVIEAPKPTPPIVKEEAIVKMPKPTPKNMEEEFLEETPKPTQPIVEMPKSTTTVKETPSMPATNKLGTKYTIQLLSLLEFSEARVNSYCKLHHIPLDKIKKIKKGEWMKITYGEANSKEEASQLLEKLKQEHQIKEAFIVPVN